MQPIHYACVAKNKDAFIAQVVRYVSSGHYFYLTGTIPARKEPAKIDAKLIRLYGVDRPRWARARRRLGKLAGMHYLRHDRFFILIATHGKSPFFSDHQSRFRDIRRNALKVGGYSIRYTWSTVDRRWRVFVRLDREAYANLRANMLQQALQPQFAARDKFEALFTDLQWQPYGPVREQLGSIVKASNRRRRYAGLPQARFACLPRMRRVTTVYEARAPQPRTEETG